MASMAVFVVWLRYFYFGRLFKPTAALIRMIIEIVIDMRWFLFVLIIAVLGFSNSFIILSKEDNRGENIIQG